MLYEDVVKLVSLCRTAYVTLARSGSVHAKIAIVLPSLQLEAGADTNIRGRSNCFDLQEKMSCLQLAAAMCAQRDEDDLR